MYVSFFNLREQPFNLTPDPRFLFLSPQHEEALSHLLYGIYERKGFIEITGEVGTGKTLLCRTLMERLDDTVSTALIFNSYLSEMELLQAILNDFGLQCGEETRKAYIDTLNQYLLDEFAAGRNAVVIIDETQNVEHTVLEQLRMLSNLETDNGKLLQVVLIGQPELREKLATRQMRQLDQRIAVRYHIHGLTRSETQQYVMHRMSVAGTANSVSFSKPAWSMMHRYCGGIPRRINLLCDRILMTAYVRGTRRMTTAIVRQSIRDLGGPRPSSAPKRRRTSPRFAQLAWRSLAALGTLGVIAAALMLFAQPQRFQLFMSPRMLALTQLPAPPAPLPAPAVNLPVPPVSPAVSPPSRAIPAPDVALARTLWGLKIRTEALTLPPRMSYLAQEAATLGFEITAFNASMPQLERLSRPCLIEVAMPDLTDLQTRLWVFVGMRSERVLLYQEPEGIVSMPRHQFQQSWYGKLYLTLEENKYRAPTLRRGMRGARIHTLQKVLQDLGYFSGPASGRFDTQTLQAVKAFQRDNQLVVDGRVGPRTLVMLFHVGGHILAETT